MARRRMSDRAEKATRLSVAGAIAAVPGLWGVVTETEWLGYVALGILLVAILAGPLVERVRAQGA
jgi:hypothetical protein